MGVDLDSIYHKRTPTIIRGHHERTLRVPLVHVPQQYHDHITCTIIAYFEGTVQFVRCILYLKKLQ